MAAGMHIAYCWLVQSFPGFASDHVDLDPIGWILSLGECQESGKADAVGDVQITIITVSNVRTGISSELANAVSFPVSDDAAVPGATHESNRNGTRGASNASAASSNGGVSL